MKRWLIYLYLISFASVRGQEVYKHGFISYGRDSTEKFIQPDYELYAKQMHNRYDSLFKDKEQREDFVEFLLGGLHVEFDNGGIYTNWKYAEEYLNRLFRSVIPAQSDSNLKISIVRSTDINAFMTGSGQAFITVGYLANALNEAEIASTLGHEYGHYAHLDAYRRYKEYLKNQKHYLIGSLTGFGGWVFYRISTANTFGNFRDMEREADQTSIELCQKANYNLLAAVNVKKRYKMVEDNYEKSKDYRRGFYFHTHPPTEERIKYTQKAADSSDLVNSKYFAINEALFRKIKLQAIDECINLLLQEQDFEECIELCYRQLIFDPHNEFYLFYMNEALRRLLLTDEKNADKLFITSRYSTYTKFLPKKPLLVISEKYPKPTDLRMGQTIFYHYEFVELADDKGLLVKLPDNELTRNDTLEFVSNKDALNYFTARQEKLGQSSVSWIKNCSSNTVKQTQVNSPIEFLNNYNQIKDDVAACTPRSEAFSSLPYIIRRVYYYGDDRLFSGKGMSKDSLEPRSIKYLKQVIEPPFVSFNIRKFSPAERQMFSNLYRAFRGYTFPLTVDERSMQVEKFETVTRPLALLAPEAVPLLIRNKLQQFIVADVHITDGTSIGGFGISVALSYHMYFNIYYFDLYNGTISHYMRRETFTDPDELNNTLAKLNQHFPTVVVKKTSDRK